MWANYNGGWGGERYPGDAQANGVAFINTSVLLLYVGPATHNQLPRSRTRGVPPERRQEV